MKDQIFLLLQFRVSCYTQSSGNKFNDDCVSHETLSCDKNNVGLS